ncbi:MAG: signal peptidase I [Pseudonocardia sp.]|nr:signal peptidase I [Pseudonocardia sp.]
MRRLVIAVVLVASLAVVLGAGVAAVAVYEVRGASMAPTLAAGDLLLVNPLERTPRRFAVVVYDTDGAATVKRVIGLPGDRVRIVSTPTSAVQVQPGGSGPWQTVVDGDGGAWPSSPHPALTCCRADGRASIRPAGALVPPGSYFVLGDNPAESIDSRATGFVSSPRLRGTAVLAPVAGTGGAPPRLLDPAA